MPGYVIHLAVAKEYLKKSKNRNENEEEFINGVIFPDSVKDKAITHYGEKSSKSNLYEFLKDKKGAVCGVKTVKLESKKDEKTGRMVMTEVAGSEKVLNAELVLIAAGFLGTQKYVADAFGVKLNERTNVAADQENYATSVERVYAAGDVRRGQSLVVWAIREGREVARAVDESLMGYSYLSVQ